MNNYLYDLILDSEGIVTVKVILYKKVNNGMQEEIKTQVSNLLNTKSTLHIQIDKKILGGLIIQYKSQILDLSISSQVTKLYQTLI